jgi:ABC-type multidrug transport system ATPase subunit
MTLCGTAITEETPKRVWEQDLWGKKAGMVFQHADEALDLEATVRETFNGLGDHKKRTVDDLKDSLTELFEGGVPDSFLNKKVKYLSGGQKQRLNLLRTIMLKPDLIVMDEPLNGLDFESVRKIIDMLQILREKGTALFMISHNEETFDAIVDREHVYYLA